MPQYIKKIRTGAGDLQIDYEALANLPELGALAPKDKVENTDLASDVQEKLNKIDNLQANDIIVDESGTRLDEKLESIGEGGSGAYVLELTDMEGTLTDEQYAKIAESPESAIVFVDMSGIKMRLYFVSDMTALDAGFVYIAINNISEDGQGGSLHCQIYDNKQYEVIMKQTSLATKEYVDNAIANAGGSGAYVLELSGESGTLTDEQYNQLVANVPNVNAIIDGIMCTYDGNDGSGYYFKSLNLVDTGEEDSAVFFSVYVTVSTDKTFSTVLQEPELATKAYVDNAVANAGGGSYVLELSGESGTLTDEQYNAIVANAPNVVVKYTYNDVPYILPLINHLDADGVNYYVFQLWSAGNSEENGQITSINLHGYYIEIVEKQWQFGAVTEKAASKDYVDNVIANAGGNYEPIDITSFTLTADAMNADNTNIITLDNPAEMGQVALLITARWTTDREAQNLVLSSSNSIIGTRDVTNQPQFQISVSSQFPVNTDTQFTLTATDEKGTITTSEKWLYFYNGIYYGAAAQPTSIDSAFVLSLSKELRSDKKPNFAVDAEENQYIWYCLPQRLGTCIFNVCGLDGGFDLVDTISFTNASGYTEDYYIYRSDNASLGSTTVRVF